jgi:plastocyanin
VTRGLGLLAAQAATVAGLTLFVACGGGGGGNGGPTGPGTGGGSPGPIGATITIANGQVSPASVTISVGQSVNFVNNDGTVRNVSSDPHPIHTDCPAINAVGNISNGQSRPTNALTTARVCGFHNHDFPDDNRLKGSIDVR